MIRGSALVDLSLADMTWDFEGLAKDTLDMELQELDERAAMESESICAIFSTSSGSRGDYAVVWFPRLDNQTDDVSRGCKKRAFLLYVCPGRVKVVKSLADLSKKMYEELATLREDGAKYCVWAIRREPKATNQHEDEGMQSSAIFDVMSQRDTACPVYNDAFSTSRTLKKAEKLESEEQQNDFPVASPRFSISQHITRTPPGSIFAFPTTPEVDAGPEESSREMSSPMSENEGNHAAALESENRYLEDQLENESTDCNEMMTATHAPSVNRKSFVSKSCDRASSKNHVSFEEDQQPCIAWQSCDGKVIRSSLHPKAYSPKQFDLAETVQFSDEEVGFVDSPGNDMENFNDRDQLAKCMVYLISQTSTRPVGCLSSRSIFTFTGDQNNRNDDLSKPGSLPVRCDSPLPSPQFRAIATAASDLTTVDDVVDTAPTPHTGDEVALSECADSPAMETDTPEVKATPVNYKNKLGARVWWELEYTARKLEQEEIRERRQQSRLRNQINVTTTAHRARRMEPTGWSKKKCSRPNPFRQSPCYETENSTSYQCTRNVAAPSDERENYNAVKPFWAREMEHRDVLAKSGESAVLPPSPFKVTRTSPKELEQTSSSGSNFIVQEAEDILPGEATVDGCPCLLDPFDAIRPTETDAMKETTVNSAVVTSMDHPLLTTLYDRVTPSSSFIAVNESTTEVQQLNKNEVYNCCNFNQLENNDTIPALEPSLHSGENYVERDLCQANPVLPFPVQGRVPIRAPRAPSAVDPPETTEFVENCSISRLTRSSHSSMLSAKPHTVAEVDEKRYQSPLSLSDLSGATSGCLEPPVSSRAPPPVATFIPINSSSNPSSAAPIEGTRKSRLNELRQKKLLKLQQTRQQREKQMQRQGPRTASIPSSVYPKKASNRQLMQNALEFTLLAGGSMEKERAAALQALAESSCDNFIVLLKSAKELKFRALYENHVDRGLVTRIFSVMPNGSSRAPMKLGSSDTISQFFKYSSAKKQFLPVATRSFTVKTDACALVDQLAYKKARASATIAYLL